VTLIAREYPLKRVTYCCSGSLLTLQDALEAENTKDIRTSVAEQ
jgi:hypothetical protein